MDNRGLALQTFVQANGWQDAERVELAADASTRSYDRLFCPVKTRSAVLMNAPVDIGSNIKAFIQVTEILRGYEFSAPEILGVDLENGFLLLEDLGDDLFAKVCLTDGSLEAALYQSAIDLLVALHWHPAAPEIAPYNIKAYLREARLFTQWYLPAATGAPVDRDVSAAFDRLICEVCTLVPNSNPVLVQRDYHAENLLWLPDREGIKRVGLLDYQDALAGHPAYDLVSLLEDARRDTSVMLQSEMLQRYLDKTGVEEANFKQAYSILGAQRNLKILGIFTRLYLRDGKAQYLDLMAGVWVHLQRDLEHPSLAGLQRWIAQNVPEPSEAIVVKIRATTSGA
ncbi:MAG: phosphotransferase [Rhodobacteraceae bacterium]|nr:phosphotransferase [Paracoccaceae bacterium]